MHQRPWARRLVPLLILLAALAEPASSQTNLDWASSQSFRYNILSATFNSTTRAVTVVFSITDPTRGNTPYDILNTAIPPFQTSGGARVAVVVGWNTAGWKTTELVNTGNTPVTQVISRTWMGATPPGAGGVGPSVPRSINALTAAKRCDSSGAPCASVATPSLTFFVSAVLPAEVVGAGRVGMEGHAVKPGVDATGAPIFITIPIKSVYADYAIDSTAVARRQIVDFQKCQRCHDDKLHGATIVPRLSLHGGNRTEEPGLCVICHNPNQTDAAYRSSGAEESVDFKRLVHGIHAGGFRRNPLVIVGFRGAITDFSTVRFPAELRNCTLCHLDNNGKGAFELPVAGTLGSTVNSGSALSPLPGFVDVNPTPDLRISPIAAACSACHDSSEVKRHMISKGASFGATQATLAGKEQCVNCHGPGREEDVRRAHEIRSATSTGSREH